MGDRKLLWILLGLSLLIMVSARSTDEEEEDFEEVEEEEEDDDDYGCDPACERNCLKLKCQAGTVRDSCGCCTCAQMEDQNPKILSGPKFLSNITGGSAAMSCEVYGNPVPFISWLKTNVDNVTFELPGDDPNAMTYIQGGPMKHGITTWLQIMNLHKIHEGDYSCVAFNKYGKTKATGRLKVEKDKKKKRRRRRKRHHHKED